MQAAHIRARTRIVQSRGNARIRELRAAFARGGKTDAGLIAIEGEHLLAEAMRSGLHLQTVFVVIGSSRRFVNLAFADSTDILEVPEDVFASATATEHPQGIAALLEPPVFASADLLQHRTPLLLVLAGLQDPGNLGTLVRSAEAFGATGVITLPGTVNPWSQKALRASAGSLFRVAVVPMTENACLDMLRDNRIGTAAAVAKGGQSIETADLTGPLALLVGNEGAGLPERLLSRAGRQLTIPCPGPVESLNAAVAGSVLLYEIANQRAEAARQRTKLAHQGAANARQSR